RASFLTEQRIAEGVAFWNANRKALERAEHQYGVAPEYVVAILGVETFYGRNTGRWRVVDALTTLAFDYPPRAPYFRDQLEHYLLLGRDGGQKCARRADPGRGATARQGSAGRLARGARRARDAGAAERVPHRLQELLRHHALQPQRVLRRRGQRSCQRTARSSEGWQIAHRIDGSRSLADLEMQLRALRVGAADLGDLLAAHHALLLLHQDVLVVRVDRDEAVVVLDNDQLAQARDAGAAIGDTAGGRRDHR